MGEGGTGLLAVCDEPQILSSLSLNSIIHKGETMKENSLMKNHEKMNFTFTLLPEPLNALESSRRMLALMMSLVGMLFVLSTVSDTIPILSSLTFSMFLCLSASSLDSFLSFVLVSYSRQTNKIC